MMTYTSFCEEIKKDILNYMPEEYKEAEVLVESVKKNNGQVYNGILVRIPGEDATPIVYLENYYRDYSEGRNYSEVVEDIATTIVEARANQDTFSMDKLTDYGYISERLILSICNYESNREYLEEVPHERKGDFAVIVKCQVADNATFTIKNTHLNMYGISKEQLFEDAYRVAPQIDPPEFKSMLEVIQSMLPQDEELLVEELGEPVMYVLTSRSKQNGAACLFYPGTMDKISKQLRTDLHIIPSSIHEVIIITGEPDSKRLSEMIHEVNATQLDPVEILGTRPSTYDAILKEIIPMCEYEKHINLIKSDIVQMGYKPTDVVVNGIRQVEKLTGKQCQLKDLAAIARNCSGSAELKEVLNQIGQQLKIQDVRFPKLGQ